MARAPSSVVWGSDVRGAYLVVTLALAQLRHLAARWALLVLGIALVVVVPVITSGLSTSVQARTISRTVDGLGIAQRTLLVSEEGDTTQNTASPDRDDASVRVQLGRLTGDPVVRQLLYRAIRSGGSEFLLGGADGLAQDVRLTSGRLPSSCTPSRCEVVLVGTARTAPPALVAGAKLIGIDVVGTAARTSPDLATGQLSPGSTPLLMSSDVDAVARVAALELFSRHYGWAAQTDASRVIDLGVGGWLATARSVESALNQQVGGAVLTIPTAALQDAGDRADASGTRLELLGGFAAVLLFGFAVVAASGLRRDTELLSSALRRRGAAPGRRAAVALAQVVIAALLAAVLGLLAGGIAVAASWADGTKRSAAGAGLHAVAAAALPLCVLVVVAALVVFATLLWPDSRPRDVWRVLDVVGIAALGAALLAGSRGGTSAGDLATGNDPIVIALPVLTAVVAGLLAARIWRPVSTLLDRVTGDRLLALRLALVGAVRRPLRPTAGAAFVTAAVACVVFTGTYRATLLANDADQAAFQVPLGTTATSTIDEPVPSLPAQGLGTGVSGYGVLRMSASTPTSVPGVDQTAAVLAPDAAALTDVDRWARVTGSGSDPAAVADSLRLPAAAAPTLPAQARTVSATVAGFDPNTQLSMWVSGPHDRVAEVDLPVAHGRLTGTLPDLGGPLTVRAFGIGETLDHASHRAHGLGEGSTDRAVLAGAVTIGPLGIAGATWSWQGWGSVHGGVSLRGPDLHLAYRIDEAEIVCVPDFARTDALTLPVITDPATASAAQGGSLSVTLDADTTLQVRVVSTLPRLPSVSGPFVLADLASLRRLYDLTSPGRAITELWFHGSSPALTSFLAGSGLAVTRASTIRARLDDDPIGEGTRVLLVIVAALALAAAAVALMLLVLGERRDSSAELYAWEADGVAPRTLRSTLGLRASLVAVVGVPIGVGAGLVLAYTGARLIAVDATGTSPTPPIEVSLGGAATLLALVVGIGAGLLAGWVVALSSLREHLPRPAELDLR